MRNPTVGRITPTSALTTSGGPYYRINILAAVKDTQGNAYTGPTADYYFYVSSTAAPDTMNPIVTALAPPDGSSNVGDNAQFRVQFSKPIDPNTVTQNTMLISGGGYTAMPSSISFDGPNQTVTITPQTPLPDGASMTIAINGVNDPFGNAVTPVTAHFTTSNGSDTTAPYVTTSSVGNGDTNVPVNSVFTVVFNEPMDTRLLNGSNFALYDNAFGVYLPASYSFSADGRLRSSSIATATTPSPSSPRSTALRPRWAAR